MRLHGESLAAPDLIYLEVASAWRRQVRLGGLKLGRALEALDDLSTYPIRKYGHRELVDRCWDLRDTVSLYDAAYVVLAAALDEPVLTGDVRLARAAQSLCRIELLE
jgi:predicted nucleic acid-binding protein